MLSRRSSLSRFLSSERTSMPHVRARLSRPCFETFPRTLLPSRRSLLMSVPAVTLSFLWSCGQPSASHATAATKLKNKFIEAFNKALSESGNPAKASQAWSDVIEIDPTNAYAWSNRGTVRLQQGEWREAKDDLLKAYELESVDGKASGVLLNNLGNAYGALGNWETAIEKFRAASSDRDMALIALANLALAFFQLERTDEAIQEARTLLRKDPNFLDMRAALTGFLWSVGKEAEAESQWSELQAINNGLGEMIYTKDEAIKVVQGRWPPRAVAALDAFLKVSRQGESLDYDKTKKTFSFNLVS